MLLSAPGQENFVSLRRRRAGVIYDGKETVANWRDFGGRSGEHEVSLASAASVDSFIGSAKYEAVPIGISKDGRWNGGFAAQKMLPEILRAGQHVMLSADPSVASLMPADGVSGGPSGAAGVHVDVGVSGAARHLRRGWHGTGIAGVGGAAVCWLGCDWFGGGMEYRIMQKRLVSMQRGLTSVGHRAKSFFLAVARGIWGRSARRREGLFFWSWATKLLALSGAVSSPKESRRTLRVGQWAIRTNGAE